MSGIPNGRAIFDFVILSDAKSEDGGGSGSDRIAPVWYRSTGTRVAMATQDAASSTASSVALPVSDGSRLSFT